MHPYQSFVFDTYAFDPATGKISLTYALEGGSPPLRFTETFTIPTNCKLKTENGTCPEHRRRELQAALSALHLAAGISYYKTCLPRSIEVRTQPLSEEQAAFWNSVYENGLGEFYFRNQIDFRGLIKFPSVPQRVTLRSPPFVLRDAPPLLFVRRGGAPQHDTAGVSKGRHDTFGTAPTRVLVPIGGGKDSMVTIELLRNGGFDVTLLRVGNHPVIDELAKKTGLPLLTVERALDPLLFDLNAQGALNGHVPVTMILSFLALVVAELFDFDAVVFSNERSASIGNTVWNGREINHQWSKSLEAERMLSNYVTRFIDPSKQIFSLLRPWSELKIVQEFVKFPQYLPLATSCNTNWKQRLTVSGERLVNGDGNLWCKTCPKCAFVFALLAAYVPRKTLLNIFGKDLFDDPALLPLYRELLGLKSMKPFECVGTPEETYAAFHLAEKSGEWDGTAALHLFRTEAAPLFPDPTTIIEQVFTPSPEHCIPPPFASILDPSELQRVTLSRACPELDEGSKGRHAGKRDGSTGSP